MPQNRPQSIRPARVRGHDHFRPEELPCPACETPLFVAAADLDEGEEVRCVRCGAAPVLTRDWNEAAGRYDWTLIDPDTGLDAGREE